MRSLLTLLAFALPASAAPNFDDTIAPLFIAKCLDCHSGPDAKAKLDLSRKDSATKTITAGELWQRVSDNEMPPKKPLSDAEKKQLKSWIDSGAKWGTDPIDPFARSSDTRAGKDWWALRPLKLEPGTVDSFIAAKLTQHQLTRSPPADARTLIRRVSFDLIGLPPTPEEIESFEKNPTDAEYRKFVEKLLASPHYGERWARHWLDLVRYGESDGFERNEPRPTAWHYRDWVIAALNADMPYDRFAKLQLAGDVLEPRNPEATKATGFLVAGIHNTVIGSNPIMRETARQDELEDIIAAVGQTFLGLTVQCARCHDHKYDPIPQADYYRLSASLGGVFHGERVLEFAQEEAKKKTLQQQLTETEAKRGRLLAAVRERIGGAGSASPIARWSFEKDATDSLGDLNGTLHDGAKIERGRLILDGKKAHVSTLSLARNLREKTLEAWVSLSTLEQGGGGILTVQTTNGVTFDSLVFAERQPKKWGVGSNNFHRTRDLVADAETQTGTLLHVAVTYSADGQIAMYRDGKPYGSAYTPGPIVTFAANQSHVLFGLRHTGGGKPYFAGEIEEARLYDRAMTADEVRTSHKSGHDAKLISAEQLRAAMTDDEKREVARLDTTQKSLAEELRAIPAAAKVYAVTPKGVPPTRRLSRGNVEQPREPIVPSSLGLLPHTAYSLTPETSEGERRAKLANWIAARENPLFARVIVNRLWHHHFGTGIVATPSDFGFNGSRPTHPELLDHLAGKLIDSGWSLKAIHRLMVTSETYRQAARRDPKSVDADNRWLWRKSPTRLDAESVRDAILFISGQLNTTAGGPPFHDVRTYGNSGTTFYDPIDPAGREFQRRTIYRFSPRGERSALLETFDCPDPSALTPRRQVTTTPLQSLALWNNSFVLRMAEQFAARVEAECAKRGERSTLAKIRQAYRLALGRVPTEPEEKLAAELVEKHGLKSLARVLFNLNEFVIVD